MNVSILTATIRFIKDTERFYQPLFSNITKTILIPLSILHYYFFREVLCITARIFALMSYIFTLLFTNDR